MSVLYSVYGVKILLEHIHDKLKLLGRCPKPTRHAHEASGADGLCLGRCVVPGAGHIDVISPMWIGLGSSFHALMASAKPSPQA